MERLSQRAYAKSRGLSRTAVLKQIALGIIAVAPDGKIDAQAADRSRRDNLDPSRGGKRLDDVELRDDEPGHDRPGFTRSRAIREAYAAENARLDYEHKTCALTPTKDVGAAQAEMARIIREHLTAFSKRVAQRLARISDEREAYELLDAEAHALLARIGEALA
jgi:hypothetical protein